jgi:hypothetical protein
LSGHVAYGIKLLISRSWVRVPARSPTRRGPLTKFVENAVHRAAAAARNAAALPSQNLSVMVTTVSLAGLGVAMIAF